MDANKKPLHPRFGPAKRQAGAAALEFGLIAIVFFMFLFGVLEFARAMYLFNTLQEVTRRAAAVAVNANFDQDTLRDVRATAFFSDRNGNLILGEFITPAHLKIEHLSLSRDSTTGTLTLQPISSMPSNPATNRLNCLANPYGASCIRFVRVQVCQPDALASCTPVPYRSLFPLVNLSDLKLPRATTIAPAESLGYTLGSMPSP